MDSLTIGCITDVIYEDNAASLKKHIKENHIDLIVFPEMHDSTMDLGLDDLIDAETEIIAREMKWAKKIDCAMIMGMNDSSGTIFNVFVNPIATVKETKSHVYIKHTHPKKYHSPFERDDYKQLCETMFQPILFKGWRIGMTICYDSTFPIFSRMYGKQGIDMLVNNTGYNAKKSKWFKYHKVRSIENKCNSIVTMFFDENSDKCNPPTYCFNRQGGVVHENNIINDYLHIYKVEYDEGVPEKDEYWNDRKGTINNTIDLKIPVSNIEKLIAKAKPVAKNLLCLHHKNRNVIFCIVKGNEILKPEKVLQLLYNKKLNNIDNKSFVILNQHKHISEDYFQTQLDTILRVRAVENYCAVILESDNIKKCYQSTFCKDSQIIKPEKGYFGIDLSRTNGPRHTGLHQSKQWNQNIEFLVDNLLK